jgi:peptidoglycan-N-acetylglucosamine deacetylase
VTGHGPAGPQAYVTTSWDDGHVLDERLAGLLSAKEIKATFYIATQNVEYPASALLDAAGLRELATRFEIGGHTLTHRRLTGLSLADADADIRAGKARLEEITDRAVTSFCYPGGQYKAEHAALVKDAGFRCARTVRRLCTGAVTDPFAMATTVQARPHPRDWPRIAAANRFRPVRSVRCFDWAALAVSLFDQVLAEGGVFHLWGHSWEVDRLGQWDRLAMVLDHISHRPQARYVTNGELPGVRPTGDGRDG